MDTGWTQDLLNWLSANPGWAGFWVFVMSLVESLAFIGILVPGIIILFGIGAIISLGGIEFWPVWLWGSLGAFTGDLLSYAVGHRYRDHLPDLWPFSRFPKMLERGRDFFRAHGAKSVVAGRFIGPLRPVIPVTAGMLGMKPRRFLLIAVPASIAWTPAYLLPGMLFGASLQIAAEYAGRLSLVLVIVAAVLWLTWWSIWALYELLASRSARWMRHAIRWLRRHPVFKRVVGPLLDSSQPEVLSIAMMGLLVVLFFWGIVVLLFLSPFSAHPQFIDRAVEAYALSLRNHVADPFMVALTQLSRYSVLIPTSVAMLLWLIGAERKKAALHWLIAVGGGVGLQLLLGWTLRSTPLLNAAGNDSLFNPSEALTLATVVLGYYSVMTARELKRRKRKWPYLITALLLVLLVSARLYLGLDWLSGALIGVALGLTWTTIVGIAYRQRAVRSFSGLAASLIFFSVLSLTFAWQVERNQAIDVASVKLPFPQHEISAQQWWRGGWRKLPRQRTQVRTVAAREFNFQYAGAPAALAKVLEEHGWQVPRSTGWNWLLLSLNPDASELTLPPLKRDYLGHADVLLLHRLEGDLKTQDTLRIWNSGMRLQPSGQVVYLGQIARERLVQKFGLFSYWSARPGRLDLLQDVLAGDTAVQVRRADPGILLIRTRRVADAQPGVPAR